MGASTAKFHILFGNIYEIYLNANIPGPVARQRHFTEHPRKEHMVLCG